MPVLLYSMKVFAQFSQCQRITTNPIIIIMQQKIGGISSMQEANTIQDFYKIIFIKVNVYIKVNIDFATNKFDF